MLFHNKIQEYYKIPLTTSFVSKVPWCIKLILTYMFLILAFVVMWIVAWFSILRLRYYLRVATLGDHLSKSINSLTTYI